MVIDLNKSKELISKENLYKHISDLDIYRKYLPGQDIELKKIRLSPLRKESNPSFGFFIGENNEICFKDYILGAGDAIRFVSLLYGLSYFESLSKIAVDFDLDSEYICKSFEKSRFDQNRKDYPSREQLLSAVGSLKLHKKRRNWQSHDILYWQQYGISVSTLEKFNVEPLEYIFINDKILKADKYTYCFIEHKDNKETYKIYQPYNKDYKWLNSHDNSVWQGWQQLPDKGHELIITKSLKDVMALYEVAELPSVALQSENILPKHHVYALLADRFVMKYSLYDNDMDKEVNYGKLFGDKLSKEFGLIECYIPDQYECKDFSDLVLKVGRKDAKRILENEVQMPF